MKDSKKLITDFTQTIDIWQTALDGYSFDQLCTNLSPDKWSLGKVYMHLLEATSFFIEQVRSCLSSTNHATEEASPAARAMFQNNNFPDAVLEGPPSNAHTPQPENKEQLTQGLIALKTEIAELGILLSKSQSTGKTKHPGLHYFNALEWLQFAEMHFRHHLRQKQRIDDFLKFKPLTATLQ